MVFCRNDRHEVLRHLFRDFDQAREQRGLVFQTAGVVNNGTPLTSLRLIMAARLVIATGSAVLSRASVSAAALRPRRQGG